MQATESSLRQRVLNLLAHEKKAITAILIYAAAGGLVSLAVPLAAQVLITSVSATGLLQPAIVLTFGLFLALLAVGGFSQAELQLSEWINVRFFRHTVKRYAATQQLSTEKAIVFYDTIVAQKSLAMLLTDGPLLALQLTIALLLLTVYHPALLVFALALVVSILAFIWLLAPLGELRAVRVSADKHATAAAIVKLANGGSDEDVVTALERYEVSRAQFFSVLWRQSLLSYVIVAVASALFLALGSTLVIRGQLSLGQLVAGDIVIALVAQNLMKLPKLLEKYYELAAALAKIDSSSRSLPGPTEVIARPMRIMTRLVCVMLGVTLLALILVPWQQTAFSQGRVIAYSPTERQQAIEAPLEGRVLHWYVQEGQSVKKGDPIVDISDNDPEILTRLQNERDAVERRFDATRRRTLAIEERIASLQSSRDNSVNAAVSRVAMAKQRIVAAERAHEAAKAAAKTADINYDRQKRLFDQGLASSRTLELAELDHQRAIAEVDRAEATMVSAKDELEAVKSDRERFGTDASAQLGEARATLASAEAELAAASAEVARMDVRLSRQSTQAVKAPRDGVVLRVIANAPGGAIVKAGDILATLVPHTADRAVELFVQGIDAPLVQLDQRVRLQFEGWPAVQFSGWPSIAIGTFGGRVALVDSASDEHGRLRVLIVPDDEAWPEPRFLRQGFRAQGWVLLSQVRLGYELWRRLNGFAASLPAAPLAASQEKKK